MLNALRVRNSAISLPVDRGLLNNSDQKFIAANNKWNPLFQRYTQNNIFINSPKSRALVLDEVLQNVKGTVLIGSNAKEKKDRGCQLWQCVNALQMAFWRRKPKPGLLYHSGRGSQYAAFSNTK